MDITIHPHLLSGTVAAIPSKSQAHRILICAALADRPTQLVCPEANRDIDATVACLRALGADITQTETGFSVVPISAPPARATLFCGESGSTLRFLLPLAGALGTDATFSLAGRLPQRPLSPLWEEMTRMGCRLTRPTPDTVRCMGTLTAGEYRIDGGVSSQFLSGLLFAAAVLPGDTRITATGEIASLPYLRMTQAALARFGVPSDGLCVHGGHRLRSPGSIAVEGDWSNAAFFLAANALGSHVCVSGLSERSPQGDRAVTALLPALAENTCIDAQSIPDLVPILSVVAGARHGARFTHISRLRAKESDRVQTTLALLRTLGGDGSADADTMTVRPAVYRGGVVDAAHDHRIAMSAAIAATVAQNDVTILGAECVEKSYPHFWRDYERLGGQYEQHIR